MTAECDVHCDVIRMTFPQLWASRSNDLSPTVTGRDGRTVNWLEVDDQSQLRDCMSATRFTDKLIPTLPVFDTSRLYLLRVTHFLSDLYPLYIVCTFTSIMLEPQNES